MIRNISLFVPLTPGYRSTQRAWTQDTVSFRGQMDLTTFFNHLLEGNNSWKSDSQIQTLPRDILQQRAQSLNRLVGKGKWESNAHLLGFASATLQEHAQVLNELVGKGKWESDSRLLGISSAKMRERTKLLDNLVGEGKWKSYAHLLGLDFDNITKTYKIITTLDLIPGRTVGIYLLKMTPTTLMDKIQMIRRHILHHQHLYPAPFAELQSPEEVTARTALALTPEQIAAEQNELEELKRYLSMNKSLLNKPKRFFQF